MRLDYIYIADTYAGHLPANREFVERYEHGSIFGIPEATTMHLDMAVQLRRDLDLARADARFHGGGMLLDPRP